MVLLLFHLLRNARHARTSVSFLIEYLKKFSAFSLPLLAKKIDQLSDNKSFDFHKSNLLNH
ncbi:hypothetical protein HYN43_017950 [Mucilaginibacter celer]|uniref:Uncharacterized protein n=1 Tax=Mucilaginibacter celer TaxID=2305508 RepID=A0A494W0Q4_9SPHI|nr:hypothetical protein HYN43_017950 [Mucilaginibacter celer]